MNAQRRGQIAQLGRDMLPELHQAVIDSWPDLLPAAADWSAEGVRRARRAARAALEGILVTIEQGGVEDRAWKRLRDDVLGHGHMTRDEVDELLRSVRIVGMDALADRLSATIGLSHDERWKLQREASGFCEDLLGTRDELDPGAYQEMLAELLRSGPDLR